MDRPGSSETLIAAPRMDLAIVPFYAALLAGLYIFLAVRVIRMRREEKIGIGDAGNVRLQRAICAHGNFSEYVPLAVILAAFAELRKFPPPLVHALCLSLLIGRAVHAYGVSQENEDYRLRVVGMALTFGAIAVSALFLLGRFLSDL